MIIYVLYSLGTTCVYDCSYNVIKAMFHTVSDDRFHLGYVRSQGNHIGRCYGSVIKMTVGLCQIFHTFNELT